LHPYWDHPNLHNNHLNNISMYLSKETKAEIFAKHGGKAENTGSAEGQIALFTFRINHLTEHLKKNRHDYNTERSLVKLVGKRRSLLDYLKNTEINRYRAIIKELNIRK
jgi:small subunit ribosomal protein S15